MENELTEEGSHHVVECEWMPKGLKKGSAAACRWKRSERGFIRVVPVHEEEEHRDNVPVCKEDRFGD